MPMTEFSKIANKWKSFDFPFEADKVSNLSFPVGNNLYFSNVSGDPTIECDGNVLTLQVPVGGSSTELTYETDDSTDTTKIPIKPDKKHYITIDVKITGSAGGSTGYSYELKQLNSSGVEVQSTIIFSGVNSNQDYTTYTTDIVTELDAAYFSPVLVYDFGSDSGTIIETRDLEIYEYPVGSVADASGSDQEVQFNDNGELAGDAEFIYDKDLDILSLTGKLGIGTADPQQLLHLQSATSQKGRIRITETSTDTGYTGVEWYGSGGNPATFRGGFFCNQVNDNMTFWAGTSATQPDVTILGDTTGNVGIGETSPDDKLHLTHNDDVFLKIENTTDSTRGIKVGVVDNGTTSFGGIWLNQTTPSITNYAFLGGASGNSIFNTPSGQNMSFRVGNVDEVLLSSAGRLSVGGVDPTPFLSAGSPLLVGDGTQNQGITIYTSNSTQGSIYFADGTTSTALYIGGISYAHSNNSLFFSTAATERVRINSVGLAVNRAGLTATTSLDVNGAVTIGELSSDPTDPLEGNSSFWMSNGTGTGDDGDIYLKTTAGGTTKSIQLTDFSIGLLAQNLVNTVYVNSVSDLPPASAGKITLADGKKYLFNRDIQLTLTDELVVGKGTILDGANITTNQKITFTGGAGIFYGGITFTGTGNMFESTNSDVGSVVRISECNLTATNATFFSATTSVFAFFIIREVAFIGNGNSLGTISNYGVALTSVSGIALGPIAAGLTFSNNAFVNLDSVDIPNGMSAPGTLFTFTGTAQGTIQMEKLALNNTGTSIYAYKFDTATTFNKPVSNHNGFVTDGLKAFAASSYNQTTVGFSFRNVGNVSGSTALVNSWFLGNSSTTPGGGSPQKIVATWAQREIERFTENTNGRWTYIGNETARFRIEAHLELDPTSGAATSWSVYIAKNGTLVDPAFETPIGVGLISRIDSDAVILSLSAGDYIEVYIQQFSGAGDIVCTSASITIVKV